ncbi:MAG: ABC transporter substrate-binding protein, partial [Chloroflexia bacterium]
MNSAIRYRVAKVFRFTLTVALFASILPGGFPDRAAAQQNCRKMNNFDVCGRFLEEWNKHGSDQANLYVSGFPLTPRRAEVSLTNGSIYEMQWFERTRFEAHTANAAPYDVLLGLLGTNLAEGRGSVNPATGKLRNQSDLPFAGIAKPGDTGPNKVWFPETRHTISGKIMEYWNRYGGLKQFGFPLSEPFQEVSQADGKPYTVQYFQRNRFELHPEKAAPYEVELGLLGVEQYRATPIMADQLPIAPPKGTATVNDTLTIAVSREPASLFPLFESASVARLVSEPIFDMLVNRDARDNLFPEIAWYVPTIENGGAFFTGTGADRHLVVKYKMRPGIKWSDGAEVTSRDALYHFKLVMDPNALVQDRTTQEMVADVATHDKYTVIYNFMSPAQARDFYNKTLEKEHFAHLKAFADANLPVVDPLYSLVGGLLPEHILGKIQADRILDTPFARNPVGSGPFKVERFDVGSQIVLVQNPNYNLTDKPLLKRIIIKIIPDLTQVVAQLRSGDLDAATSDLFSMPIQSLDTIGGYQKVEYAPNRIWERIDFNLDRPFFQDKSVRVAIAFSINRQQIIEKVMLGKAPVL